MLPNLPLYISIVFALTTFLSVFLFYKATNDSNKTLGIIIAYMILQAIFAFSGFYQVTDVLPPRILVLGVLPTILTMFILFLTSKGRAFIDSLNPKILTILHTIRIPVEFVLLWLFLSGAIPQIMTFEGQNFDIIAGLTAPFIYYFGFVKQRLGKTTLLIWNFLMLALLLNIVITATLCAPLPFQQFALNQPNIAIFYFPFVWLPTIVVPIVMFSHFATIRQLIRSPKTSMNLSL